MIDWCIFVAGERSNTVLTTVPVHSNVGSVVNHSFVVTAQPSSGQMLLTTAPPHLPTNVSIMSKTNNLAPNINLGVCGASENLLFARAGQEGA